MTVLRECAFFASLLFAAAQLSTQAYNPQTLRVLPSSPCEFEYCYDATISRVGNITYDARASPRDVSGLYLIPAKDLLLQVVQPERCFMACLSRLNVSNIDAMDQYNIPNTATLNCLDNLSPPSTNSDLYNPLKEIQFHQERQFFLSISHLGDEQAMKHNQTFHELSAILEHLPLRPQCSDLCYVPRFGICASAFDGNTGKQECVSACLSSSTCSVICNETVSMAEAIIESNRSVGAIPAPVNPPAVYLTDDWMLQTYYPALFYDISGEEPNTVVNATNPVGLIWKVEPANSAEVLYYPTHFRHPFDQSGQALETENVYHLFTHYNHGGMAGYLRFLQFCQSANISYAFVNASGYSGFSPPTTVCFPGEYQPSPPQNMSIDASFNTHGLLEVNITIERSPDHELVQSYDISAVLNEGRHLGVHCPEGKVFSLTFHKGEALSIVMTGRDLQEYNFTSVWNCNVTFTVLVHPHTPNGTLSRYLESEEKVYRPKQMIASFLLQEVEIPDPQVVYSIQRTFNDTSGLADVSIHGSVISNSSNESLKLETFLNSLQAKLVKLSRLQPIPSEEEKQTFNFSARNGMIVFNDLSPTSTGEKYNLTLTPDCCFILNTKYWEIFREEEFEIIINPVAPSNLQNLTVLHHTSESGIVNFRVSWLNSELPYGNARFIFLVSTSNGTQILSNQTIFYRRNGQEAQVLPSQQFTASLLLPISKSGSFDFAVQAVSNWGARSAWLNDSVFVEYYSAGPIGLPAYVVGLPCAVGAVAAILLVVIIIACVWYYHRNKVVVISTSSLFVENAMTVDDGTDEAIPLHAMDSWELGPQDVIVLGQLGEGNFGEVYRGLVKFEADAPATRYHSDAIGNLLVAVKLLKSDATIALKSEFLREIALMKKVSGDVCPYVVNMVGCCTHQEPLALVLEYAANGDLLHYLRSMRKLCNEPEQVAGNENHYVNGPEASACEGTQRDRDAPVAAADCAVAEEVIPANFISFGWQIASGMEYLSQLGIVHRDLACRNVLVCSNKQLKVSDFGLAREDGCYVKTTEGKLPLRWMAIESIQERVFTTKSDVWSFGVTLWEITTLGGHPYPSLGNRALLGHLLSGKKLEKPKNCSLEWYHLMSLCWALNPGNRPHFKELRVKLEEMLSSVHQAHYIDLNAGTEDMPYYPMSAASADDSCEDDLPLELSTGQVRSPYLEPNSFTDKSTGEALECVPLAASRASNTSTTSSSSSSAGDALPGHAL